MNDHSELDYGNDMLRRAVLRAKSRHKDDHAALEVLGGFELSNALAGVFYQTYAFSMSKKKDLLSQWMSYANGGNGFAIGFATPKLLESINQSNSSSESASY